MRIESADVNVISTETILDKLRRETRPAHKQLEELPLSLAITNSDVTLPDYLLYLHLMQPVINDVEQHFFPLVNHIVPYLEQRRKLHLIESDLSYSCKNRNIINKYPLSRSTKLTAAFAMGVMYVIEGSTLGGRVILKNINKHLGFTDEAGCRYFAGYKAETGSLWKSFLAALNTFAQKHHNEHEIIDGAVFAFNTIYNQLKEKTTA